MALQLTASIYGVGSAGGLLPVGTAQGTTMGFPTQGIRIEPASQTLTSTEQRTAFQGVEVVSCIQVLPTGLNTNAKRYYSTTAVGTLITAANA